MTNNDPSKKLAQAKRIGKKVNNSGAFEGVEETILRFFRWLSSIIDRLFQGKHVAIFALLLTLVMYVSVNISENAFSTNLASSKSLSDVSVVARYNSESFEISGLPKSCDVVLTGDAAVVNNAAAKTGYCLINLEGYTEGTHSVNLSASGYGDNVSTTVVPSQTQITLKHKTTSQFDITYDYINKNSLDSRFILAAPVFAQENNKVNIRASQDTLNGISMVKALIDVNSFVKDVNNKKDWDDNDKVSVDVEAPLIAYDTTGKQVNAEIVPNTVKATINVSSPSKTVPILIKTIGDTPIGTGIESISMDQENTKIYASSDVLNSIEDVVVTLDLSTITSNSTILQPITLPSGVSGASVTVVNIKVELGDTSSKILENVPIVFRNNDNNLGASEVERTTVTVTAVGTEKVLENVTSEDCVAYINLKDGDGNYLEPGTYDLPIYIERKNENVYAVFSCDPNHVNITLVGQE